MGGISDRMGICVEDAGLWQGSHLQFSHLKNILYHKSCTPVALQIKKKCRVLMCITPQCQFRATCLISIIQLQSQRKAFTNALISHEHKGECSKC